MQDNKFMQMAIDEAYEGIRAGHGGPFGSVIVKDDQVLAAAHNTVLNDNDPTQHAEVKAISIASRKIGRYDLQGCTIYSTTESCPMCFSAIHWANLDKLVFGTDIEDVRKLGFNELPIAVTKMKEMAGSRVVIEPGCMKNECLELLGEWKELPDKRTY